MNIRICDMCEMEIPRRMGSPIYKLKLPKAWVEEQGYAGDGIITRRETRLELCDLCWYKIRDAALKEKRNEEDN